MMLKSGFSSIIVSFIMSSVVSALSTDITIDTCSNVWESSMILCIPWMVLVVLTTRCCVVTSLSNIFAEVEKGMILTAIQRQNNVPTDEECNRVTKSKERPPGKARSHGGENPRTLANSCKYHILDFPLTHILKTDNHDQARTHLL